MPHIDLGVDDRQFPGITGLSQFRPETGQPLMQLAQVLLRGPSPLTAGERELIASYVSTRNECTFCALTHAAFAATELPEGMPLVEQVRCDLDGAPVSDRLRALLRIAGAVQLSGREVTAELVAAAKAAGATDLQIHDTVLIAAAFCMYNRYVDGLATYAPEDLAGYVRHAESVAGSDYPAKRPA